MKKDENTSRALYCIFFIEIGKTSRVMILRHLSFFVVIAFLLLIEFVNNITKM